MRILFAVPYIPSLIRVRPYHFVRELARRHDVTVLATPATPREIEDVAQLRRVCSSVAVVPPNLHAAIQSCVSAALRGDPLQSAVCRSPALMRRLQTLLAEQSFDLVHVEHLRAAHLREGISCDIPTIYDSVDSISLLLARTLRWSVSLRQRLLAGLELHRTRAYEARLLSRFDQVTVTSSVDARALRTLDPCAAVAVVPNGVDLDYFQPVVGPREPATLVFSGKMSYHANVSAILHFVRDIFPHIRRLRADVRLRIIGSSPPAAVQALTRDPAIAVTGHVADIRQALGTGTIALCPVTVKAGIQNKILEAMAMGLPVVSTRQGAEGLDAEPGRHLLVADGPAGFAAAVCHLLAEPSLREELGRAGRRYVAAHHRWENAARQLESLYQEAVERRTRQALTPRELQPA